jgi:nicotinate-nucleotide adenylyltransferase
VVLDGARSNFELGSRLTLGHLTKTMRERRPPKVAVFFGTFDPVHEGHIDVARRAAEEFGLDEVLLVPNAKPLHKPGVTSLQHRVRMTAIRVSSESKLNAYVGDSSPWVDGFGKDVFFKHVEQIYGTKDLYEIYGGDSFEKLMGLGQLKTDGPKYILFKREMTPGFTIPEHLRPHVLVSDADLPARSSTQVRNAFKSGQTPPASLMRPEISSYIQQNGLYGAPAQ